LVNVSVTRCCGCCVPVTGQTGIAQLGSPSGSGDAPKRAKWRGDKSHVEVSVVMGVPQNGGFIIMETPILGNLHVAVV